MRIEHKLFPTWGLYVGLACVTACGDGDSNADADDEDGNGEEATFPDGGMMPGDPDAGVRAFPCDPADNDIALPEGFCALTYARELGTVRHITVTPAGDLYAAVANKSENEEEPPTGGIIAMRDTDGDGVAEQMEEFGGPEGGNGITWHDGQLYFAMNSKVLRWALPDGQLVPEGDPTVVIDEMVDTLDHPAKTVVVAGNELYVNCGSASNACQEQNREPGSPGVDPCPELENRSGIWVFDAGGQDQRLAENRFATGARNFNALAIQPGTDALWGAQNGRDQLHENWPELFTMEQEQTLPSEVLHEIDADDDFGWPYCFYDGVQEKQILAPEYGGDGTEVGRCADLEKPAVAFPAHWAPLGMAFYTEGHFPARYSNGLFITFHGSWHDPEAEGEIPGYNVVFQPFADGQPSGAWETFADEFAGDDRPLPDKAKYRPVGVAVGPDGSLYISDDHGGTIWRVIYVGD
jgi:glucose/arabinose dehydrogenase